MHKITWQKSQTQNDVHPEIRLLLYFILFFNKEA